MRDTTSSVEPALYSPATLAHVRATAALRPAARIAADLGWDLDRLKRVARAHGIELIASNPMLKDSESNVEGPAINSASLASTPPPTPAPSREVRFGPDVSLQFIIDHLPRRQASALALLSSIADDRFLTGQEIAARIGGDYTSAAAKEALHTVAYRLQGSRWRIETRPRRGGGYRLVKVEAAP